MHNVGKCGGAAECPYLGDSRLTVFVQVYLACTLVSIARAAASKGGWGWNVNAKSKEA